MDPFWHFARRMLRYRGTVAVAVLMALISAGSLGAGLVAVVPVLGNILDKDNPQNQNLPALVTRLNNSTLVHGRISQAWIDSLPTGAFTAVVAIIGLLGVLTVFGGTANFLHAFLSLTVVQRTVANIRREAFHRVLRLPLKDIVVGGAADKVSRIINDTASLENGFTSLLSKALAQLTKGLASAVAAFVIDWKLALSALILVPPLYTIIRRLGKKIRRASRSALASQAGLLGAANEALQGLRVVKVHTSERYEAGRFHHINKEVMRQTFRARTARALATPVVEVLTTVVFGGLFLVAAKAVIKEGLESKHLLGALGALFAAGASLKPLTGLINDIQVSSAAAGRIKEMMDAAPEPGHDSKLPRLPRHEKSVEFRDLTFTYPGQMRPALTGISLRIRHGERIAVVGPNGSGKTTLLALVPRLFDPDGAEPAGVYIDGMDIRTVSIRSLRRQIGVVTQETVLFRGSVRGNIAYGAEDVTMERIEAAARKARAHDFIAALPQGYETLVGEQGLTLSGGQRQRIAIARAILREPAILILDEATSMIDADSEAKIADAIAEFSAGRTCLIVAHRLSTVIGADRIIVMDQGTDRGPGHARRAPGPLRGVPADRGEPTGQRRWRPRDAGGITFGLDREPFMLVLASIVAFMAADPEPRAILQASVDACRTVTSLRCGATHIYTIADQEERTDRALVTFQRLESDTKIGARARIDFGHPQTIVTYAYDGQGLRIAYHEAKRVSIRRPEDNPTAAITGNIAGKIVTDNPILRTSRLSRPLKDAKELTLAGTVQIDGQTCDVVRAVLPGRNGRRRHGRHALHRALRSSPAPRRDALPLP
jgi:ABC-type multidrug transport system fused ATPase/permease subunit